jgi:hypothetical protein
MIAHIATQITIIAIIEMTLPKLPIRRTEADYPDEQNKPSYRYTKSGCLSCLIASKITTNCI